MSAAIIHHWYLGLLAVAFIFLFARLNKTIIAIRNKIVTFRFKLFSFVSAQLEPDTISAFREAVSKTFDELKDFLEKSELELLRSRMDNVFLKDKIHELERNQEALLQELGGSPDFLNIEFTVWKQAIQTIDLLISDRSTLLQRIETAISYDGSFEKLLRDFNILQQKNQTTEKEIDTLSRVNSSLQAKNKRLSQDIEGLQSLNSQRSQSLEAKSKEITVLKSSITTLQKDLSQSKILVYELQELVNKSSVKIRTLESANQTASESNEILKDEYEKLRNELCQKDYQIQQLLFKLQFLESYKTYVTDGDKNTSNNSNYRLRRKVSRLRKYLRQADEQFGFLSDNPMTND